MSRQKSAALVGLIAVALLTAPLAANAGVIITVSQVGSNVDVTATGTLNLTGATAVETGDYGPGIIPGGPTGM
jgi:hypothetical protein